MVKELDPVILTRNVPEHGLVSGDVGTVVHLYDGGAAYEVEFIGPGGRTIALLTLLPTDVREPVDDEVLHARRVGTE